MIIQVCLFIDKYPNIYERGYMYEPPAPQKILTQLLCYLQSVIYLLSTSFKK